MQIDKTINLNFACEYKVHDIIFVNSGSNYYVRLPVDGHAALISDNNSGKTSSLSALKLFLLPETTFKKQDEKFGFSSGGKFYSDIASYTYYFPSSESFIICNASNPKGKFSWVLYRTTNFEYERIAVPHEYDAFAHLFWNGSSKSNENAGELQPQISVSYIKDKLRNDFDGRIFNERKSIGESIYTRTSNADDDSRFCLIPMAKGYSTSNAETIRSLLNMAFSLGNASTTSLPKAIAAIVDSTGMSAVRKSNNEGIFLDLDSQLDEWRELKAEDARLKLIESQKPKWEQLQRASSDYQRLKRLATDHFKEISWALVKKRNALQVELEILSESSNKADAQIKEYNPTFFQISKNNIDCSAEADSIKRKLADYQSKLEKTKFARSHFSPLCPNNDKSDRAILLVIEDQISLCEAEIEALKDQGKAITMMETLNTRINTNKQKREQLTKVLHSYESESSFLKDLSPVSASVLVSLNQDFARISLTPTMDQTSKIDAFTRLFSQVDGKLFFCDAPLMKTQYVERNIESLKQTHIKEISSLDDFIEADENQLIRLKKNCDLSKERQAAKLIECSNDLEELKQQKIAINSYDLIDSLLGKTSEEHELAEAKLEEVASQFELAKSKLSQLKATYDLVNQKISDFHLNGRQIDEGFMALKRIEASSNRVLDINQCQVGFDVDEARDMEAEEIDDSISMLEKELRETLGRREESIKTMVELLEHGIIESTPEERYKVTTGKDQFETFYSDLQTVFLNLDVKKESYRQRLAHHNNTAATAARMIENVEGIVTNFIKGINDELQCYHISNLSSVELFPELHPQYKDMIVTLSRVGSRTDQLLSETFYKQISDFQDQFYIKNPGKIDIAKIIVKISYRFGRKNSIEDTPQSNGTNCMVNAVLLALLLKRMVPEDLNLTMPVIFDEIGSLDEKNLSEILKVMQEHGMYLFAANPEQNGVIASVLHVYHNLSVFKATGDVRVYDKAEAIYFPGMEERLENIPATPESEAAGVFA